MDEDMMFSLSYEQMTTITEQYISQCIQNAMEVSSREADIEMDRARASLEHWYLLAQACNVPETKTEDDRLRMTGLIWCTPSEEERT